MKANGIGPNGSRPKRTVCIVGNAPTRILARGEPDDVEIWGTSLGFRLLPRIDRWFELHADKSLRINVPPTNDKGYMSWLQSFKGKVYVLEPDPEIPQGIVYPTKAIIERFGHYLTDTIAYELALAIYEGVTCIKLYGVDMALDEEYAGQRPCVLYYLGIAKGAGNEIVLPEESALNPGKEHVGNRDYLAKGNTEYLPGTFQRRVHA